MCRVCAEVKRGRGTAQCSQLRVHSTPHPTFAFELHTASNGFDFDRDYIPMSYLNIKYTFYLLSLMGSLSNARELIWSLSDSEIDTRKN